MTDTSVERVRSIRHRVPTWLLRGVQLLLVVLVAKPAASKFRTYDGSVAFFDAIGMPAPSVLVVVAGIVEVIAVLLLLFGVGARIAALSLIPVMVVAILYAGPDWKNLAVIAGSITVLLLETEPTPMRQVIARGVG